MLLVTTILEADKLWIHPDFAFLELLRSDTNNSSQKSVRFATFFRIAYALDRGKYPRFAIPRTFALSGTPLNECVLAMFDIAPMVQKETKCQELHIINLTDGEGNPMYCSKKVSYRDGQTHVLRRLFILSASLGIVSVERPISSTTAFTGRLRRISRTL